jgi:integrator complex subunit 3
VDCILPLIPKLSFQDNAEALTHIMLLLRREKPSAELIKHLMSREPNPKVSPAWTN